MFHDAGDGTILDLKKILEIGPNATLPDSVGTLNTGAIGFAITGSGPTRVNITPSDSPVTSNVLAISS